MSMLLLLLLASAVYGRSMFHHEDDSKFQPFVTASQSHRICTELCMSGLGGEPCGSTCMDIIPQEMPLEFSNTGEESNNQTRRDACTVLCPNQLGYPLCECGASTKSSVPDFRVNYVQICGYYCLKHNYRLYGCQSCNVYKNAQSEYGGEEHDLFDFRRKVSAKNGIDWNEWCKQQCLVGNGGAACNCDILPFSMKL